MTVTRRTLIPFLVIAAFALGVLVNDLPLFTLDPKISIIQGAQLLTTMFIAIYLPRVFSKLIDDRRHLKNRLMDEVTACIDCVELIKTKIETCYSKGRVESKDRRELQMLNFNAEMQISGLCKQLKQSFVQESRATTKSIYEAYIEYWKFLTGGPLITSKSKVDEEFCKAHHRKYWWFVMKLKESAHSINHF